MTGIVVEGDFGEPARASGVGGAGGDLTGRVTSLEGRMNAVETVASSAARSAKEAADNTRELLAIATATKGAIGFAKKHGPKVISFGCGVMTILGFGNPELWHYISNFFGH